jgi:ribonuclease HI
LVTEPIVIYTDGSCKKNPGGPGGWAAIILRNGTRKEFSGYEKTTTSQRMEMTAAIEALKVLQPLSRGLKKDRFRVTLITDSKYLIGGMTSWIFGWKNNGWRTCQGKPVKNKDLWQDLWGLSRGFRIVWKHVRGHSGNRENERCDDLAREQSRALKPC